MTRWVLTPLQDHAIPHTTPHNPRHSAFPKRNQDLPLHSLPQPYPNPPHLLFATEMQSNSIYQCPICPRHYKRREHLKRHRSSHTSERPHRCPQCDARFQRADVLRRHLQTCLERRGSRGVTTRRRACDRCVRQKKACDLQQPCDRCAQQTVECCYSIGVDVTASEERITPASLGNAELAPAPPAPETTLAMTFRWPDFDADNPVVNSGEYDAMALSDPNMLDNASPSWQDLIAMVSEGPPGPDNTSFQFLDKMTSNTGLAYSFDCGTPEQRAQVLSTLEREVEIEYGASSSSETLVTSESPLVDGLSLNWLNDPLSLKTHQILHFIKDVVMVKPRNSSVTLDWSSSLQQSCLQFFSPANLRKYLGLYWAIWHPNVNFIHRPSFDSTSAKPTVLAAMTLLGRLFSVLNVHMADWTGACMSPETSDNEDARMWFNCVEELVFTDEDFNSDFTSAASCPTLHRNIVQALQAAYMVCLYQNWEGSDASKRRIRRCRFASLVSVSPQWCLCLKLHAN